MSLRSLTLKSVTLRSVLKKLEDIFFIIALLNLIGASLALASWQDLHQDFRELIIYISSIVWAAGYSCAWLLDRIRQRHRKQIWQHARVALQECASAGKTPHFRLARHLTDGALRVLAAHIFHKIGYEIADQSDREIEDYIIKCVNPEGGVELVHVKQLDEPVGLRNLHMLTELMEQEEAVTGHIWAPGGFTSDALRWAADKPLSLEDDIAIGHMVDFTTQNQSY